ncbi:MAG: sugar phosphate isomerase/epimerase [Kiritimatiellae bacterium]|nr:sugar phosphate isomerase/epimerase [Kiritimatiellia bacterium]
MKFCVETVPYLDRYGVTPVSVRRLFRDLEWLGIRAVRVTYQDPDRFPEWRERARTVAGCVREFGFRVCAHAPATDISASDPTVRRQAVAVVDKAIREIGAFYPAPVVVAHPENVGAVRHAGDDADRMRCCRESLAQLAQTAQEANARLALENMRWRPDAPNRTGMYVDQLSRLIAGLTHRHVGICFDVGHANISEGKDLAGAFTRNAERIIHVHLDDNDGRDDLHLPPGAGTIDFPAFYRTVRSCAYEGLLELEVAMPKGDDPLVFYARNLAGFREASAPEHGAE